MSDKKRYPYADALKVAVALKQAIAPFCSRIEIVGSLRRRKATVGDIEILYVSRLATRKVDLLSTEQYSLASEFINSLVPRDITKRASKTGVYSFGELNKLAVHVTSGIPVDFFQTVEPNWWNSLVCRTGGKDSNLLITTTAQRQGLSFEAYGSGFRKLDNSEHWQTNSERHVFEFLGLPYLEPGERP